MKKCYAIVLTIWAIACIIGCAPEKEIPIREENFSLICMDTEIAMKAPAQPILEALGEPMGYTEETSCAFDGLDKTYYYGSFYLTTYPEGEEDYIYSLWFADDTVSTPEGITIGSPRSAVEAAYGPEHGGNNAFVITQGESTLMVILTEDTVSAIRYDAVFE